MGAFGDSYWEDHPMTYTDPEDGIVKTDVGGVGVPLKEYLGEKEIKPKFSKWTAYKNTARGALFLGGDSSTDYKPVTDKSKALTFTTKEQVQDYIKDFNEELKKAGEPKWMPIELK